MAEDQPHPPASSNHGDQPGQPPAEPLGGPTPPPEPPPAYGQPGPDPRSPAPTAQLPGDQPPPPGFAAAGPPREALAGFWQRLGAAFLDGILVGIVAAAIGQLFGVKVPSPASAHNGGNFQAAPGPFVLVALAYFTYFHATSAGQSIGNKILGIRVLDAGPRAVPRVPLDAVGTPQADLARHRRQQPGRQGRRLPTRRVRPPALIALDLDRAWMSSAA
jgi:RDD family